MGKNEPNNFSHPMILFKTYLNYFLSTLQPAKPAPQTTQQTESTPKRGRHNRGGTERKVEIT